MSSEEKPSLDSKIDELTEMIKGLIVDNMNLRSKIESLEAQGAPRGGPEFIDGEDRAVVHTLQKLKMMKEEQRLSRRDALDDVLENAARHAIADYKKYPPRHRR